MADRAMAAGTLVLAAAYLLATWRMPEFDIGDPLGPKAFPYLLGGLLAFAGVLLFFERRPAAADGSPQHLRAVVLVLAATGLLFALLEPLGYLVAITLYLFALMHWLHRRRPAACAVIAILFAIGSYALFAKGLGVTLAKGLVYF